MVDFGRDGPISDIAAGVFLLRSLMWNAAPPKDSIGALVTRQNHAFAVVHVDGQAPGLKHAQLC